MLADQALGELARLSHVLRGEPVCFVEHENRVRNLSEDVEHERELVTGDRRIRAEDHQRRIDVRHKRAGHFAVGGESRPDAGCVDETEAACQERSRKEHFHDRDTFDVLVIVLSGHIQRHILNWNLLVRPGRIKDRPPALGAVA